MKHEGGRKVRFTTKLSLSHLPKQTDDFPENHLKFLSMEMGNDSGVSFGKNYPLSSGHEKSVVQLIAEDEHCHPYRGLGEPDKERRGRPFVRTVPGVGLM